MATLVKDTHKLISFLQAKGYTKDQAEGFVNAVKDFDVADLATKADLKDLRLDLTKTMFAIVIGQIVAQTALIVAIVELLLR